MRRPPTARVASAAVTHTKMAIEDELGWLFREQPTEDYGIDAHAEVVEGEDVRGRLIALQIKGGSKKPFKEPGPGGWWYRPDPEHVQYWTNHSLPVAIVLYDPRTKRCYWQLVNNETLVATKTGKQKVFVPEKQVLDQSARLPLKRAAEGEPYVLRIRELQLAKPWMEMLKSGTRLVIDMEEWVNKTSGRGTITLGVDHEDGHAPEPLASWGVLLGLASYAEIVPRMFAWADVDVHHETYDIPEHDEYEAQCAIYDEGDTFYTITFDEWRRSFIRARLRPYKNGAGEVDYWRLELTLNELGRSFLSVDDFATSGLPQFTPVV
ncbi:MAG: DUF4365 domain-containing protein [Jatrophihabitantaceae bacterium]